jgi:hypothetical protein
VALTVTLSDLAATPTGATATIAGSAGGTVTVYAQAVSASFDPLLWAAAGTRTGDGTVTLALDAGLWWVYAGDADGQTVPQFVRVTGSPLAVLSRCVASIETVLGLLALPCTARVYDHLVADAVVKYPCTVLTTAGTRETIERGQNNRDDLGHGVRLLVKDVCHQFDARKREAYRVWRQAIFRAFHNQRLPGVPESVVTRVDPGDVAYVDTRKPQVVSTLNVKCVTREVRGIGA